MKNSEKLDKLVLNGVTLEPYAYSEDFRDDGSVKITAKVTVSGSWEDELKKLMKKNKLEKESFPVVRRGINEEPLEMRFGKIIWSTHDDGNKYLLHLFEKSSDKEENKVDPFSLIGEPQLSNVMSRLSNAVIVVREIADALYKKGILTSKEIAEIRSKAADISNIWEEENTLYRVSDIDAWSE